MKHAGADVTTAAKRWRHYNVEADRLRSLLPPSAWLRVHYEALCADPQATLDAIARFLGVDPAPIPSDLRSTEHHIIGNSMCLRGDIREDRSWETALARDDPRTIARIARPASWQLEMAWTP
jgi:sulfotransferase family protein